MTAARGLYVAGSGPATGKSAIAIGLQRQLVRRVPRLGVFRPVVERADGPDPLVDLLRPRGADAPYEASLGATYDEVRADPERALEEIVARFRALAARCDGVLAVGTDFADVGAASRSGWRTGWSPAPPTPRRRRSGRASR